MLARSGMQAARMAAANARGVALSVTARSCSSPAGLLSPTVQAQARRLQRHSTQHFAHASIAHVRPFASLALRSSATASLQLHGLAGVRRFSAAPQPPQQQQSTTVSNPSSSATSTSSPSSPSSSPPQPFVPVTPVLSPVETFGTKGRRLWVKVKAEARHYWLGTKLLWKEVKLASRLCLAIARGHEMSRRERRQLLRTSADLVRMVPFVVILVIPFAEFALPILLKIFPRMLPSTYLDATGEEAKLKKELLVKMEMARFLQETTHLLAQQIVAEQPNQKGPDGKPLTEGERAANARSFRDFMAKVRAGKKVNNADILAFTKLFDAELTLDNLDKKQLEAMCRLLDIRVFGSVWVLRYKLEERLRAIQKDDLEIKKEGIDELNEAELHEACRARGIFTGKDSAYLRRKLSDWLELSLEHKVPIALLLLSRAFSRQMTGAHDTLHPEDTKDELASDLAETLAHVPEVAVADAEKELAERSNDREARLKLLEEEDVTAAFEELQASKAGGDGKTRAAKLRAMKPAVGVTTEKIARLEVINDDVERTIDETIAKEELEKQQEEKAAAAETTAAATPAVAATPAAPEAATPAAPVAEPVVAAVPSATAAATAAPSTAAAAAAPAAKEVAPAAAAPAAAASAAAAAKEKDSADKSKAKEKEKKKKTIAVVDKLNDSLGAMIDDIKAQAEELEKAKQIKVQQQTPVDATAEAAQKQQQQQQAAGDSTP